MLQEIETDCRKLLGLKPFDTPTNIVCGDGYFYQSLCKQYGKEEVEKTVNKLNKER